ncbi:sodium-translocating pyrophosphatase [Anaerotalea alkaliphila]|uniref:Putative K(+)-stimulated pyrophosphate-energized sodium pump n=1 Tax=Anaerotalea alkaliphila TaxID=2662126 RepID=A0A7X5HW48_9FIRM|nr:sodium-translocating pyrophosphatase [Anaerotalea alkaliphila]NDL67740.1 sodium-translocating pyrophosphatase [Anaerotalea alkaliphila]
MQTETLEALLFLVPASALASLGFAAFLSFRILRLPQGTEEMRSIAAAIRQGAGAYLKRQYTTVSLFFVAMALVLSLLAAAGFLAPYVPVAFLTGGFFSGLAGFIGMRIATQANVRTAAAARESIDKSLRVAFDSGTVTGLCVVGLGLLFISLWYFFLNGNYRELDTSLRVPRITSIMLTFGMGASAMALFARVGGGIFTKAADVGADLVGKVEAGIPEDDPRNPAVIADNVGDNVGDVAGMGADLYESYVGSILSTMALASAAGLGLGGVGVPLLLAAFGLLASILGTFLVRTREGADQKALLRSLRRGVYASTFLTAVLGWFLVLLILGPDLLGVYASILSGLLAGILMGLSSEYYTSASYTPTRNLAASSQTGPATVVIRGLSLGMSSTVFPVVVVAGAIGASFFLAGGGANFNLGLYGVGLAAVGMLSTLAITLATDAYGPVADNAGGIAEMSGQPPEVRDRTDALDSLGNTTAATGKGFAIGSAALTALALIAAFQDQVQRLLLADGTRAAMDLSLLNPRVLMGLLLGATLPFLFAALTMNAVGKTAELIVAEVRRQFREIPGIMERTAAPDHAACVDICTRAAQREILAPAALAILAPILTGLVLGVEGVAGLLGGATATGFLLAVMMANAGGAWDNAKKHIEAGAYGGKGSSSHKAAVVGDTVGDPFKDTSGPSINILIKLLSMVAIVFAGVILRFSLF